MIPSNTLDLTAKLLANENINVVRAPVSTASFNIVTRTLTLPQWKEMSPEIDQMLVAHEVAHALYTPNAYLDALVDRLTFPQSKMYLNILEDVRVEKLIKRKYPGLRKVLTSGYRALNDMDFFGIKGRNLTTAHLMDRINLYFKVGYGVVSFSAAEKPFVVRAEALETVEETIQLAEDIHKFLKEQADQKRAAAKMAADIQEEEDREGDGEGDGSPADDGFQSDEGWDDVPEVEDEDTSHSFNDLVDEGDESGSDSDSEIKPPQPVGSDSNPSDKDSQPSDGAGSLSGSNPSNDGDDDEAAPFTNASLESRVSELADTTTEYRYWTIKSDQARRIQPYKKILETMGQVYNSYPLANATLTHIRGFKRDTQNNVDYLVKEFEMRKAATTYKRTQTSKSGSLDMRKVWSYKVNDDLFKRVTAIQTGKNHGMVFLLDWSGSMGNVIRNTIDQVINLAMFCQRAGISYQVFAFTDGMSVNDNKLQHEDPKNLVIDTSHTMMTLLEIFSDKMSTVEFNTMVNYLKSDRFIRVYPLNGTPLNEALVYMYDYIDVFRRANNVEKVSLITLTDGEGGSLPVMMHSSDYNTYAYKKIRNFIRDQITKRNYEAWQDPSVHTTILIKMIKDRYNCTIVGFYITKNSRNDLAAAVRAHFSGMSNWEIADVVERLKSEFRTQGYGSIPGTGRDDLFIVPIASTRVQYEKLDVDGESNVRSIAARFGKYMTVKKTSRILLNKFINYIA